jgi:nucleoside-diphosphate-sugar epimerase
MNAHETADTPQASLRGARVLVTGATGFLGGVLVRHLLQAGAEVCILARNAARAERRLGELPVAVVVGDLGDPAVVMRAAAGTSHIFHAAAALGGSYAAQRAANVDGTRHMMRAAAEAGARVVHVSSIAVYGNCYRRDVRETDPMAPGCDPYAITKAEAERVVVALGQAHGVPYSIVRPGMIYGVGSHAWTALAYRLAKLRPTPFVGDGSGSAHAIHVDDVCRLLLLAALHPAALGQAFNCTPDPAPTWRDYLGAYQVLAGHRAWLAIPVPLVAVLAALAAFGAPRYSQQRDLPDFLSIATQRIVFSTHKARERLGWTPQVPLQAGVAGTADWLRAVVDGRAAPNP